MEFLKAAGAWFSFSLPNYHRSVVVAFTAPALEQVRARFGRWDLVLTWDQCQAWALGVAELDDPTTKAERMAEALRYFEAQQFGQRTH